MPAPDGPNWLRNEHGEVDYAATAIAMAKGIHPDQLAEKARRDEIAAKQPVKPAEDSRANPKTTLYHGTSHVFAPGEKIEPRSRGSIAALHAVVPEWSRTNLAYLTSSLNEAKDYASLRATSRFSPVYEATGGEPHSAYTLLGRDPMLRGAGPRDRYIHTYVSKDPMTPTKIVAWAENPRFKNISPQFSALLAAHRAMTGAPSPKEEK